MTNEQKVSYMDNFNYTTVHVIKNQNNNSKLTDHLNQEYKIDFKQITVLLLTFSKTIVFFSHTYWWSPGCLSIKILGNYYY